MAEENVIPFLGFNDPLSSWSHLIMAVCGLIGTYFLLKKGQGNLIRLAALAVFSVAVIYLFSMSGVFHLLPENTTGRAVLQRLDHSGIWVLIAGTFTPIHMILFRKFWRWGFMFLIWSLAITGLVLEVVFFESFPRPLLIALYLALGWIGAFSMWKFHITYQADSSQKLLVIGGVCYTIGAILELLSWPVIWAGVVRAHELFHLFVAAGAICHWAFIYRWAHFPVQDTLTFHVQIFPSGHHAARAVGEKLKFEASSLDELKEKLTKSCIQLFAPNRLPKIKLKYFNEEYISI